MSGGPRGGRQVRVRRYVWRDRGVATPGATIEIRQGMDRRSVFVPYDRMTDVADGLIDVFEEIQADEGDRDAHSAA